MKIFHVYTFLCVFTFSTFADDQEIASIVKSYESKLEKLTPKPILVNSGIFVLCRLPSLKDLKKVRDKENGPHFSTYISIYVDKEEAAALKNKSAKLPVGTVIVKKKSKAVKHKTLDGTISGKEGLGGMIKRDAGYDLKNGDWEYFYQDKKGKLSTGKLKNCIECHQKAKQTDYVFRAWKDYIETAEK